MSLALILSSHVAATRIGGGVQQLVLSRLGLDPVLVPTVLLGRSPALGATPYPTPPEAFARLLADVEEDGAFAAADLVITGHFSSAAQVESAAAAVARVRLAAPGVRVVVDPIMGDAPKGLYVKADVAQAVAERLVPLADWITPNAWELERLTGVPVVDVASTLAAARRLPVSVLATSVPGAAGEIGLLCVHGAAAVFYAHARADHAANGTGDLVAAVFGAGLVEGLQVQAAAAWAARAVIKAVAAGTADLPVAALTDSLLAPGGELRIETLS